MSSTCVITAVNNEAVLRRNLLQSPFIADNRVQVICEAGHESAAAAYNAGRRRADADYLIFAHQDVYFPAGWEDRLDGGIASLERAGEPWAVLGVWGICADGNFAGRVWCSGGDTEHVAPIDRITEVASIDEIVIVAKASAQLQFDEQLPGFHLYATDLILQAHQRGLKAFVIDAPVVHNSWCNPQPLGRAYWSAYRYMQKKWASILPVKTCVVDVTRGGWPLYRRWAKNEIRRLRGKIAARPPAPDPRPIAARLGYEPVPTVTTA